MEHCLELLDFLNFKLTVESVFKKKEEVLQEIRHYLSALDFKDSPPYSFFSYLRHLNRQVIVHVDVHNVKGNLGVHIDMQNR